MDSPVLQCYTNANAPYQDLQPKTVLTDQIFSVAIQTPNSKVCGTIIQLTEEEQAQFLMDLGKFSLENESKN